MVEEMNSITNEKDEVVQTDNQAENANRNITRMMEERENLSHEAIMSAIEDNDWLQITDNVKNKFLDEGFVLRWIRIMLDGQEDHQNIGKKEREGWTFVLAKDCSEMSSGFKVKEDGPLSGCILRGDVALAKQRIEYHEAIQAQNMKRTQQMEDAISSRLHSDHPDRRMPIYDSSKQRVSTGKQAKFDT
tara:strand:- start:1524 stop:2090 length:567 start_codon:yes stop_codon:yes gene_type:complete